MLPQAQKDIRRALRGLDQQLLGDIERAGRASLGSDSKDLSACDLFVEAVEKCGLRKLLGSEALAETPSLMDFVTGLSTEEMGHYYLFMNLDKSGVCTCDGTDRSVMKRLILDELYMTGFEALLSTFPDAVLSKWCECISGKPSDKLSNIKCVMANVFKLNFDFDSPKNETENETETEIEIENENEHKEPNDEEKTQQSLPSPPPLKSIKIINNE